MVVSHVDDSWPNSHWVEYGYLLMDWQLSTKAIPIECPECGKPTKMLGRVDACMHCKQPLTFDRNLEGKEFDEKYNSKKYWKEQQDK